eukprot:GGOE01014992.1.p1 GENE.GGOE01014992.1~~GGOE01014992.1.p1  ORF type:complete len:745 (-),score=290.34 GGOE01014992.1:190-2424(-)
MGDAVEEEVRQLTRLADDIDVDIESFRSDENVQRAMAEGVDLREYSRRIERELAASAEGMVQDYLAQAESLLLLRKQIGACDGVLANMESILQQFQDNICTISDEIQALQDRSFEINVKLKNRKQVADYLHSVISNLVLSPAMIRDMCSSEPNEAFLDYLKALNNCHDFFHNLPSETGSAELLAKLKDGGADIGSWMACPLAADVGPVLSTITLKTCGAVRDFLLQKIESLKKPKTNIHILQQNVLLKYKRFVYFLQRHHPVAAQELKNTYVATMSHIYFTKTKSYIANLVKLEVAGFKRPHFLVDRDKLLGADATYPVLGNRWEMLDKLTSAVIVPHVEVQGRRRHYFENVFRSMNLMLMDIITAEYLFTFDFFYDSDLFVPIFDRTIPLFLEAVKQWIATTCDYIALLLCIHMCQQFLLVMHRRRIPCLNQYLEHVNMLLWPRFKEIFDINVEALRHTDPKDIVGKYGTKVNKHCERYAEFSGSILLVMFHQTEAEARETDSPVTDLQMDVRLAPNMSFLRITFDNLLVAASQLHPTKLERCTFLVNNYHCILAAWTAKGVHPAQVDFAKFHQSLEQQVQTYVEMRLAQTFSHFVKFVKETEPALTRMVEAIAEGDGPGTNGEGATAGDGKPLVMKSSSERYELIRKKVDTTQLEGLARDFSVAWLAGIRTIKSDVIHRFQDPEYAAEVLRQIVLQIALYNARFTALIGKCWLNPPFRNLLVPSQHILHEVRKSGDGDAPLT